MRYDVSMLTAKDHKAAYHAIEAARLKRIANLRKCMESAGSWEELARWCAVQPSVLKMVAGPRPVRNMGEKLARSIESALGLEPGWLDR